MGLIPIIPKENSILEPNRAVIDLFVVHFTPPPIRLSTFVFTESPFFTRNL